MSYEEWVKITRLILDFYSLSPEKKEQILLMIDGYRFRAMKGKDETPME